MKRNFHRCLLILLSLLCLTMAAPALAESPAVKVGVSVVLKGTLPDPAETFTIQLMPDAAGNPMPEGVAEVRITGEGSATLPEIAFDRVGVYSYTIRQLPGAVVDCVYDSRVYHLTVYVTNAEDGDGLESAAVLYTENEADKKAVAVFENVYPEVGPSKCPTPTPSAEDGTVTPTGVVDSWQFCLAGAVALLVVSGVLVFMLRRKEDHQ